MIPSGNTNPPLARFLRRLELRNRFTQDMRAAMLAVDAQSYDVPAGRDIVCPGQSVDHACLVDAGVVGRYEQFRDGTRRTTVIYIAGDMADLHSIAFPEASWGLSALSEARISRIPHAALEQLRRDDTAIALAFWRDTIVDASISSKWISVLSRQQAHQRLAHLLCEYGRRIELAGIGTRESFTLPMTQETLSEILGVTPTHINRVFSMLRAQGLIATGRRSIEVLDPKGLENTAEYDSAYLLLDDA